MTDILRNPGADLISHICRWFLACACGVTQDALPDGAGDVSESKLQKLEQEAKDLTSRLQIVSAEVGRGEWGKPISSRRQIINAHAYLCPAPERPQATSIDRSALPLHDGYMEKLMLRQTR